MLLIKTDSGEFVSVHAFHTVLANALEKEDVKAGDRIGIKYLGEAEAETGTAYRDSEWRWTAPRSHGRGSVRMCRRPPTLSFPRSPALWTAPKLRGGSCE